MFPALLAICLFILSLNQKNSILLMYHREYPLKWIKKPVPTEKNQFLKFLSLKISIYILIISIL